MVLGIYNVYIQLFRSFLSDGWDYSETEGEREIIHLNSE